MTVIVLLLVQSECTVINKTENVNHVLMIVLFVPKFVTVISPYVILYVLNVLIHYISITSVIVLNIVLLVSINLILQLELVHLVSLLVKLVLMLLLVKLVYQVMNIYNQVLVNVSVHVQKDIMVIMLPKLVKFVTKIVELVLVHSKPIVLLVILQDTSSKTNVYTTVQITCTKKKIAHVIQTTIVVVANIVVHPVKLVMEPPILNVTIVLKVTMDNQEQIFNV